MASPTVTMTKLRGRLQVLNPSENELCTLLVFASRDRHVHAAFNEVIAVANDEFEFESPLQSANAPAFLHFVLFSNRVDKAGILYQSCLAWGHVPWPGGLSTLVDVKGRTQAVVQIPRFSSQKFAIPKEIESATAASERMIARVRSVYSELQYETNSFLCWVMTSMGKLPVLSFLASLSSILTDSPLDSQRAEEFLLHQFALAGINTGHSDRGWASCDTAQRSEWVAEAVLLIPRAMIYQPDLVRMGKGQPEQSADQWVRLLSFPEPNRAGFDCEDSAILTLELLYLLQHVQFRGKFLRAVQAFLAPYTACFIFGSLKVGSAYSPHAYSALIDSKFLDGSSADLQPAIVFEGTARIGGSWTLDSSPALKRESFDAHSALLAALSPNAGYARVMRSEASMRMASDNGVYGPIHAVISGDHHGRDEAIHLLAHAKGSSAIGVSPQQIFSYSSSVAFKTALHYTNARNSEFTRLCNELPRSLIPFVSESGAVKSSRLGRFHMDIHYETYVKREGEIERAVQKMRGKMRVQKQVLQITDQLRVQQLWFD